MTCAVTNIAKLCLAGFMGFFIGFGTFAYASEKSLHNANIKKGEVTMTLTITSPAFSHSGKIPMRYTCDGEDVSPALEWSGLPEGTKSVVLIVDDPDAPDPAAPKMTGSTGYFITSLRVPLGCRKV